MNKTILAFVGMPGAGKSEATACLEQRGFSFVRFGDVTDEGVKELGLPLTTDNERIVREKLRKEFGMGAYAIKSKPKIDAILQGHDFVVIDGLYSWEEYTYLKKLYSQLILVHIYAEPKKRYERLSKRPIRPVPLDKSFERDVTELENLNKGGPIALSDYMIENNSDNLNELYSKIDALLNRLGVN